MRTRKLTALVLFSGLMASASAFAADLDKNIVSAPCAGCHGTGGVSAGDAPIIAGLPRHYLLDTMMNYKRDRRYGTVMNRIAKGYDAGQMADIADYFSNQAWVSGDQKIDSALVKKGKDLHRSKGCVGCHGAIGISPMPTTPRLAGQYSDYLVFQMQDYQNPDRPIPPAAMAMRGMLQGLSIEDLTALAHFYASQKP